MLRTTFVVSSMRGGGTERVVTHMANYWARRAWPVTVLTLFHGRTAPAYALDPRVMHYDVGYTRRVGRHLPDARAVRALKPTFDRCSAVERRALLRDLDLIATLRRAVLQLKPELVISFIDTTNVRVLLATEALGVPVIVSERNDPVKNPLPEGLMRLRRRVYPKAAWLVSQTPEMAAFFAGDIGDRGRVIGNPVARPPDPQPSAVTSRPGVARSIAPRRSLVAMGRLVEEKGFRRLLRAFAMLAPRWPEWSLTIWGIGPQRDTLLRQARELHVGDRVSFPGFTHQPVEVLRAADLFVLPSSTEGFPNVLCEAMACGRPVISTDCSPAVRHIIRHDIDGIVVAGHDAASLGVALERLMTSEADRIRLGARAVEVIERFSLDKTMAQWEELAYAAVTRRIERAEAPLRAVRPPPASVIFQQPPVDASIGAVE